MNLKKGLRAAAPGTMLALILAATLVALLGMAGRAAAQDIKSDYDNNVDFHQFHTYTWVKLDSSTPFWGDRIRTAVDAALAAKGLTRVDSGGDLEVSALGMTRQVPQVQTYYDSGWGPGWGWQGGGWATTSTYTYPEGTLVVDLFSRDTKQLVWRGSATDTLSDNNPEKNQKKLDKAVDKLLDKFPPK